MTTTKTTQQPDKGSAGGGAEYSIWTEQDCYGMFSYDFVLDGKQYEKHDFLSRANAIEDAKSRIRCIVRGGNDPENA